MQAKTEVEEYLNDSLNNKLFSSKIPTSCKSAGPCILGIDEAGRGPVLGPMVYAVAYYPKKLEGLLSKMKFADSKQLSETKREELFEAIQVEHDGSENLGYTVKIVAPNMISNSMLRRKKYNLNLLSHDTAIDMIKHVESAGIQIDHVYVDTVGDALQYKAKLSKFFPKYQFTVSEKADSKYAIVSAASVCAKVVRDRIVKDWKFAECPSLHLDAFDLGSGYPGDAGTKRFLEDSLDPVFGFPTLARFSWSTIPKLLDKSGCKCDWNEPEDDKGMDPKTLFKGQNFMKQYFKVQPKKPVPSKATGGVSSSVTSTTTTTNKSRNTMANQFFDDRSLTRVLVWN